MGKDHIRSYHSIDDKQYALICKAITELNKTYFMIVGDSGTSTLIAFIWFLENWELISRERIKDEFTIEVIFGSVSSSDKLQISSNPKITELEWSFL